MGNSEQHDIKIENLYIIGYGLGGGFGGARTFEVVYANSEEDAMQMAFDCACEEYEQYAGSNGLRCIDEIMEDEDIDDEDLAIEIYEGERESWLDYSVVNYSKENEEKVMYYHYQNNYKSITDNTATKPTE